MAYVQPGSTFDESIAAALGLGLGALWTELRLRDPRRRNRRRRSRASWQQFFARLAKVKLRGDLDEAARSLQRAKPAADAPQIEAGSLWFALRKGGGAEYRIGRRLGAGGFGGVYLFERQKAERGADQQALPSRFAVKFFIAQQAGAEAGGDQWDELRVLRRLQAARLGNRARAARDLLASRLLFTKSLASGRTFAAVAMEPADCSLAKFRKSLGWSDAAAVTRAALDDLLTYWRVAGLVHADVKPGNFLFSAARRAPIGDDSAGARAAAVEPAAPRFFDNPAEVHVFAADFGGLVPAGGETAMTFSSPGSTGMLLQASWSLTAFQLGWMCVELLRAPGEPDDARWAFESARSELHNIVHEKARFPGRGDARVQKLAGELWLQLRDAITRDDIDDDEEERAPARFVALLEALLGFDEVSGLFLPAEDAAVAGPAAAVRFSPTTQTPEDVKRAFEEFDRAAAAA